MKKAAARHIFAPLSAANALSGVALWPPHCSIRAMQSHELLKEVLKKTSAKQIAGDLGLSLSLIYKWAEPPQDETGSGANNPLDRIE